MRKFAGRPRSGRCWDILLTMGKMTLGLDDRSARLIHGKDVWTHIKDLLSGYSNIQAAIAFVGPDADQHLPLRGPATIVVNAGDDALRRGVTDPHVLLRWTRRGVRVYSLPSLHAKVILAEGNPSFVMVGSANVLAASGRQTDEAVLVADERETVDELRDAITEWKRLAGDPLTDSWLQAATSRFRPPTPHRLPVSKPVPVVSEPVRVAEPVRASEPVRVAEPAPVVSEPVRVPEVVVSSSPAPPPPPAPEPPPPAGRPVADVRVASGGDEQQDGSLGGSPRPTIHWPRPKYIYLATLTRDGRASDSAEQQLEQLRAEFRVPGVGDERPTLDVDMFWWDEPGRSGVRPSISYREGWHIVPISVPTSGRPAVLSPVDSPGRVLNSFTDFGVTPARTYYYLLKHSGGPSTTFRRLREALTAVGEKPSYDHAYMMQHKVAAILNLWPQISYTD